MVTPAAKAPPPAAYPYGQSTGYPQAGYPQTGYPQPGYAAPPAAYQARPQNTSAIVLTIISALLSLSCYFTIAGIAPLIFGIMALTKQNADFPASQRMARYGWIAMAIGGAITVLGIIGFIAVMVTSSDPYSY